MKITKIVSHVLQYDMPEELGYSQQFYARRSAHLVEVKTDEGVVGWGECFGPGNIAIANKGIVGKVIQPMILGDDLGRPGIHTLFAQNLHSNITPTNQLHAKKRVRAERSARAATVFSPLSWRTNPAHALRSVWPQAAAATG